LNKTTSSFKSILKWLAIALCLTVIIAISWGWLFITRLADELPDTHILKDIQYQTPLKIYSRDGSLIAQFGDKKRTPVKFEQVPEQFVNAFLAAEDSRFYEHQGVDFKGLLRAAIQLILSGKKKQGGSTITMQVARNFLLTREKTYIRKLKEIMLSLKIEREFSKQDILELYLNKIYLGHHAYGVAASAQVYYGKTLDELNLAEQAMIAGLPKAPSKYNPIVNPERALLRRNYVLRRMFEQKFIGQQAYDKALLTPVTARLHTDDIQISAPYIGEMVRNKIIADFGEAAYNLGLKIYTTIEKPLQIVANDALIYAVHAYDERHGYRALPHPTLAQDVHFDDFVPLGDTWPARVQKISKHSLSALLQDQTKIEISWENINWARKYISTNKIGPPIKTIASLFKPGDIIRVRQLKNQQWRLTQTPKVEGAFVAIDPNNGAILALTGGFDFKQSKYNRAAQSKRQPGSGFKPIIYTTALEKGYTAASIINDAPVVIDDSSQESEWRPENYSRKFFGPTRLRTGLRKSRNLISIRLLRALGIPAVIETAIRFGFAPEQLPHSLTLALGSGYANPIQMVRLYAVFANGGQLIKPFLIDHIKPIPAQHCIKPNPPLPAQTAAIQARQTALLHLGLLRRALTLS